MAAKRYPSFNLSLDKFTDEQQLQLQVLMRQLVSLRDSDLFANIFTDTTRPTAGAAEGRVIFNSTDGQLNIDDGTNWTLPDGTTT